VFFSLGLFVRFGLFILSIQRSAGTESGDHRSERDPEFSAIHIFSLLEGL
jgi:hypothetical protein